MKQKDFKEKVYKIVKQIPKGEVLSYKKVAEKAGESRAWRSVGKILAKNKNPQIPCHRVVRLDAGVGGYNKGFQKKIFLLKKEGLIIKKGKIKSSF